MRYLQEKNKLLQIVFENKKKQTYKPGSVTPTNNIIDIPYHLSGLHITVQIYLPTLQHRASNPQTLIYMAFHRIEFT